MSKSTAPPRRLLALILGCALLPAPAGAGPQQRAPHVPGAGLEPELHGRILFEELRCWACHEDGAREGIARQPAPELRGLNQRVDAAWLTAFLSAPPRTARARACPTS